MTKSVLDRYLSYIEINPLTNCWEWTASLSNGYGRFKVKGRMVKVHRWSYSYFKGFKDSTLQVLHKCDNPKCSNPDHLFEGTHTDNMRDMSSKGRARGNGKDNKGSENPSSKLEEDKVKLIIEDLPLFNNKELGLKFGVSHGTISLIRRGKTWKHLPRKTISKKYESIKRK